MAKKKVVFVDDNTMILRWARRAFGRECDVQTMECPSMALSAIGKQPHSPIAAPDIIVSNFDMPYMNGVQFLTKMRDAFPAAELILYTGRHDVECSFATVVRDKDSYRLEAEIKRRL